VNLNTEADGTGEFIAEREDSVRAVVNWRVCELAVAVCLLEFTICKCLINPNCNPNLVYSHSNTWQHQIIIHVWSTLLVAPLKLCRFFSAFHFMLYGFRSICYVQSDQRRLLFFMNTRRNIKTSWIIYIQSSEWPSDFIFKFLGNHRQQNKKNIFLTEDKTESLVVYSVDWPLYQLSYPGSHFKCAKFCFPYTTRTESRHQLCCGTQWLLFRNGVN
jgi:hypothetical protein